MSSESPSFISLALNGYVFLDEIDNFVDSWHSGAGNGHELFEFLGMNESEYALWVQSPEALAIIIRARREHIPLVEAINHDYNVLKLAARAQDANVLRGLSQWLRQRGFAN